MPPAAIRSLTEAPLVGAFDRVQGVALVAQSVSYGFADVFLGTVVLRNGRWSLGCIIVQKENHDKLGPPIKRLLHNSDNARLPLQQRCGCTELISVVCGL